MTKSELISELKTLLNVQYKELKTELDSFSAAKDGEQKSSAGDKHETAKAMADIEAEKISQSLDRISNHQHLIGTISPNQKLEKIGFGAKFTANGNHYFVATSYGKLQLANDTVFVLSKDAPLALHLNGAQKGDKKEFNGQTFTIESVA